MLQELAVRAWHVEPSKADEPPRRPLYVVAEKIVSGQEALPRRWAVHGTTGYNYLNDLNGLFVNSAHGRRMRRTYAKLTGRLEPFDDVVYASNRLIMETGMASELNVLAHMLNRIGKRRGRDFTLGGRGVITEVVACFPVCRAWVSGAGPQDHAIISGLSRATRNPAMELAFDCFQGGCWRGRRPAPGPGDRDNTLRPTQRGAPESLREAAAIHRPVHAKARGYVLLSLQRLLSLNEVGDRKIRPVGGQVPRREPPATQCTWEMICHVTHDAAR